MADDPNSDSENIMILKKINAFIPYPRWNLKIFDHNGVKFAGVYDTQDGAKTACCDWYLKITKFQKSFEIVVIELDAVGINVIIDQ